MESIDSVKLAREKPFALGDVSVIPSALEVTRDGRVESVEPRVMQVLVVLARADGVVVPREELIDRCWDGRIVSESAVNRVMSRIRHLGEAFGDDSFRLETINKVGYRLTPPAAAPPDLPDGLLSVRPAAASKRLFLLGTGAAIAGIAAYGWFATAGSRHSPPEAARTLYEKGKEAQHQFSPASTRQAIAYFREAVRIDPDYARAWGALALGYSNLLETAEDHDRQALVAQSVSAGRRARALDPGDIDAEIARILVRPLFRNWAVIERDVRNALRGDPDHVRLRGLAARLRCDTGRFTEGAAAFKALVASEPFFPAMHNQLALAMWHAGRLEEAERAIDRAIELWPEHVQLRSTQFHFLALTGRPALALASIQSVERQPVGRPPILPALGAIVARALETRASGDVASMVRAILPAERAGEVGTLSAVMFLAATGAVDASFALLDGYYFGESGGPAGRRGAPGPLSRRETDILFSLPTAPLRGLPRFTALTRAVGLEDYWRATGTVPDYRR